MPKIRGETGDEGRSGGFGSRKEPALDEHVGIEGEVEGSVVVCPDD